MRFNRQQPARRPSKVWLALRDIRNRVSGDATNRICGACELRLVHRTRPLQPVATAADVADLPHETLRQLGLNARTELLNSARSEIARYRRRREVGRWRVGHEQRERGFGRKRARKRVRERGRHIWRTRRHAQQAERLRGGRLRLHLSGVSGVIQTVPAAQHDPAGVAEHFPRKAAARREDLGLRAIDDRIATGLKHAGGNGARIIGRHDDPGERAARRRIGIEQTGIDGRRTARRIGQGRQILPPEPGIDGQAGGDAVAVLSERRSFPVARGPLELAGQVDRHEHVAEQTGAVLRAVQAEEKVGKALKCQGARLAEIREIAEGPGDAAAELEAVAAPDR